MSGTSTVGEVLDTSRMVLVCGSGGVGKTTVSAALGLDVARRSPRRVLVITVDPARRLADALGIQGASFAGTDAVRVTGDGWAGELWVSMLDTKAGWDELIRRHAPDRALAERVLANPLYHNITSRFVNSHDYIAMEQLHHLDQRGEFDLVIVDTPPSRNALDLIDAPGRMREFFASALLRWLTVPARSKLLSVAAQPFNKVAERVLGSTFLQDITDFFVLLRTMEPGFVARAAEVEALLAADRTAFAVVTTGEESPSREAAFFVEELRRRGLPLRALVFNRMLPASFETHEASAVATTLAALATDPVAVDTIAAAAGDPADGVAHVLGAVGQRFPEVRERALRESERCSRLRELAGDVAVQQLPALDGDVHDLAGLVRLAAD